MPKIYSNRKFIKPQFERPRIVCQDGIVRYPYVRIETLHYPPPIPRLPNGRRGKEEDEAGALTRADLDNFEKIWGELYLSYLGEKTQFFGKRFLNKNKLRAVSKILRIVKENGIDLRLYLKAQFDASRNDRSVLILNRLYGPHAMRIYERWIAQFPRQEDAVRNATPLSIEEILTRDHRTYLAYRRMRWPDRVVFRTRYRELSHFYLFASEEFSKFFEESDSIPEKFREDYGELWHRLARDPQTLNDFWELVRKVKCKVEQEQQNLTSVSR